MVWEPAGGVSDPARGIQRGLRDIQRGLRVRKRGLRSSQIGLKPTCKVSVLARGVSRAGKELSSRSHERFV